MKIRLFGHRVVHDVSPESKPVAVAPAPRHPSTEPPPRVWSLLLPPGFTNDRR